MQRFLPYMVIFELQQFLKIILHLRKFQQEKVKAVESFQGQAFHFLSRQRKCMGHGGLCTFDLLSLLIAFFLKLICAFIRMCLRYIGVCVCIICVHIWMCVNTFGFTISYDMETSSFAFQFFLGAGGNKYKYSYI